MTKSSLVEGAAKMTRIVRAARERQRSRSGIDDTPLTAMNPSDAWARKYLSEAIGPDMPRAAVAAQALEVPSAAGRAQFMHDLKAATESKGMAIAQQGRVAMSQPGKMSMERPFAPTSAKRSALGRLLRG